MATVAKSIQKQAYGAYGMVCFFTGVQLVKSSSSIRQRSIEHLCPVSFGKDRVQSVPNNHVPALRDINTQIGNCPLRVKFRLRSELAKLHVFPGLDEDGRAQTYIEATRRFLDTYRVHGVLPWCWKLPLKKELSDTPKKEGKYRSEIRRAYQALLTQEEIDAGFYVPETFGAMRLTQQKKG